MVYSIHGTKGKAINNYEYIYILLTDTGTILTRCIKLFTKSPYNHSSISLDSRLEQVYSFGRKETDNPFHGGFVKENVQNDLFRFSKCKIYRYKVTIEQYLKLKQKLLEFEKEKYKYKYNFLGLIGVMFKQKWVRPNAFFCSQFVAYILDEVGISVQGKPNYLMTPNDLVSFLNLQLVFHGTLHEYLMARSNVLSSRFIDQNMPEYNQLEQTV